ncbi:MAG: ROK family transcriptional regulator [Clostridia bacterium]|nr:ROK family transcriptional regulator [Clostridia bacterium]
MNVNGINMSDVKNKNIAGILRLLCREGSLSRKDIAAALGLTPAAVTIICAQLLERGIIRESGHSEGGVGRAGRHKILLTPCFDKYYAISVNIETDVTYISLVRLNGEVVFTDRLRTLPDADTALRQIAEKLNIHIKYADPGDALLGVGVGIVGAYNAQKGETDGAFGLWERGLPIEKILHEATGLTVVCENNAKCFAAAELLYGEHPDNAFFIKWGSGIGSALISDGHVSRAAQEIGHYIVDPDAALCRCGRRGCLETYASSYALKSAIGEMFSPDTTPVLYGALNGSISDLMNVMRARGGEILDEPAYAIFRRCIKQLAIAAVNTATVLDPEKIIVFGNLWNDDFLKIFKEECKMISTSFAGDFIHLSSLQDKRDFIGPAALVTDRILIG